MAATKKKPKKKPKKPTVEQYVKSSVRDFNDSIDDLLNEVSEFQWMDVPEKIKRSTMKNITKAKKMLTATGALIGSIIYDLQEQCDKEEEKAHQEQCRRQCSAMRFHGTFPGRSG